jgi:hypothetical protein
VRVDHESHLLVRNFQVFQCRLNLLGQRRILVVHDYDSVLAHGSGNVTAFALQHVNIPGNPGYLDFHPGKILVLRSQPRTNKKNNAQNESQLQ